MHSHLPILALAAGLATAKIPFVASSPVIQLGPRTALPPWARQRQAQACFIIDSTTLPAETAEAAAAIASTVTCSTTTTTLSGVPDVTAGDTTFSSIDFSQSSQTPLGFALSTFATEPTVADSDLQTFQDELDTYVATEAGIRSVGGDLAIKVPKFFLEFQVSRIQTAQGNSPADAGLQVDHLRDKVLKNAAGEDQTLLDQVTQLATHLV
ncbi:Uu.00g131220.m01.CDS01 [Anthostomella pinea]|uniref:Uu.00g131220.m01.CDS01 n=1 Tax=Anthostomella pinea TaxID=933095 RepID=A0AAI8YFU5_9PEZI|nr:Uu.00g131220.m01.CDS01 [Anthostomella pinea]